MAIEQEPPRATLPAITKDGSRGIFYRLPGGILHSPLFGPLDENLIKNQLPQRAESVSNWHLGRTKPPTPEEITGKIPQAKKEEIERERLRREFLTRVHSSAIRTPNSPDLVSLFEIRPYPQLSIKDNFRQFFFALRTGKFNPLSFLRR